MPDINKLTIDTGASIEETIQTDFHETHEPPLLSEEEFDCFFKFLEVQIEKGDKDLFIHNLLNSQKDVSIFKDNFQFTKLEIDKFIHNHYQTIWTQQHKLKHYSSPPIQEPKADFNSSQEYKKHIELFKSGDETARSAVFKAMVNKTIEDDPILKDLDSSDKEIAFFKKSQRKFNQQFKALKRLHNIATELEGQDFLHSASPPTISSVDYRRWADDYMRQEIKATNGSSDFYKLNGNEINHSNKIESGSLKMRIALTAISITLAGAALLSGDPTSLTADLTTATGQTAEACDTLTSLVNAILFIKNKQPGLALLNLSIGVGRLTSHALAISVIVAPALFSATAAASFSFLTPACSLAMVGLYQYRMHDTAKKIDILQSTLNKLNDDIHKLSIYNPEHTVEQYTKYNELIRMQSSKIDNLTQVINKHSRLLKSKQEKYSQLKDDPSQSEEAIDFERSIRAEKAKISSLKLQLEESVEKNNEFKLLLKASKSSSSNNNEYMQLTQARETILHTIETEKAAYNDYKKSRNLWLSIAAATACIATTALLVAGSTASLGLLPLVLGVTLGAAFIVKEYFISGKHAQSQTLDDSSEHSSDFDYLMNNKELFHQKTALIIDKPSDFSGSNLREGYLSILDYLQDLRRTAPNKAKKVTHALRLMTQADVNSTQYIEAKSRLMQAAATPRHDTPLPPKKLKGYLLFSNLLNEKIVGLNYLKDHKQELLSTHLLNLNIEVKVKIGSTSSACTLIDFLKKLANKNPEKAQAIITSIYQIINETEHEVKEEAREQLTAQLKQYTNTPDLISNHSSIPVMDKPACIDEEATTDTESISDDEEEHISPTLS